jgi:hypothetical protein
MEKCPKCSSSLLMDHLQVVSDGQDAGNLRVQAQAHPQAFLFRGAVSTLIEATVCGGCGYIELYSLDPKALVDAVAEAERRKNR